MSASFFRLSRNFSDHQDRKVSTLSKNFPGCPKTIQKISRLSGNFTGYQELSGPSGKYPDYPESFQAIWKFSRLPGNFPDYPGNIQAIWKLSRLSKHFPDNPETFQTVQKFFTAISRDTRNTIYIDDPRIDNWSSILSISTINIDDPNIS